MPDTVLHVTKLRTVFDTQDGKAVAVNNISFSISRGETLGLVGESGCGKTVTALSLLRLVRKPGRIEAGNVFLNGENLLELTENEMRDRRGNRLSIVFQEPMSSLNPVFTIGEQLIETYLHHLDVSRSIAKQRAIEMLSHVGIPHPAFILRAYPHQLSGGLRQRVLIAMALACVPSLLIADEPTTAIDVTVQIQILRLLNRLKNEFGMAILLITHDLGVVAESCDRVAVMYASNIIETGPVKSIFQMPSHPYTSGLLKSIPAVHSPKARLRIIPGQVPQPMNYPPGCNFYSRCSLATEHCLIHNPILEKIHDGHEVACWNWRQMRNT